MFETNSSSTHSITVACDCKSANFKASKLRVGEGGVCTIYPGQFGWEEERFTDCATKASYCLTWANQQDQKELFLDMLRSVIKREMGDVKIEFFEDKEAYIDHQSNDEAADVFESEELLHRFIFDPASVLITDNDNH